MIAREIIQEILAKRQIRIEQLAADSHRTVVSLYQWMKRNEIPPEILKNWRAEGWLGEG